MSLTRSIPQPRRAARPRIKPAGCVRYVLLMDSTRTLFCAQPDWAAPAALREGWDILCDDLEEDQARQYRADLYAGRISPDEIIQGVA